MQVGITEISTGIGRSRLSSRIGRLIAADQARSVDSSSRSPSIQSRIGRIWPETRHSEARIAASVSTSAIAEHGQVLVRCRRRSRR